MNVLDMDDMLINYLNYVEVFKASETKRFYVSHLKCVVSYFHNIEVNNKTLFEFVRSEQFRGIANSTINKRIVALKMMYKINKIKNDELFSFPYLREIRKNYGYLEKNEIKKLVDFIDNTTYLSTKIKCLVMLILYTGVRRTEALNIKIKNINLDLNCILLEHTKNKCERVVYFKEELKEYLVPYLNGLNNQTKLFDYTNSGFGSVFERIKKALNFKNFSAHVLRHTYATILVNNNATLDFVQISLGHNDIRSTQIYTHMSRESQRNIYNSCFKI